MFSTSLKIIRLVFFIALLVLGNSNKLYACDLWKGKAENFDIDKGIIAQNGNKYVLAGIARTKDDSEEFIKQWLQGKNILFVPETKGKKDRYGRCSAYIVESESGELLQNEMIKRGMAIVYVERYSHHLDLLLHFEQKARSLQLGIWEHKNNLLIKESNAMSQLGKVAIIKGRINSVNLHKENLFINFGDDWRDDFTGFIPKFALSRFDKEWLLSLAGKEVNLRGNIYERNGPSLTLYHPYQIEISE